VRLYYEREGEGPPLVLIPGLGCDLNVWAPVRKELARHFSLVLLDNRCMGRSQCPQESFTLEDMAGDVLELIELLQLERPHIIGHSMGGSIAQLLARDQGDRLGKVILLHAAVKCPPVVLATLDAGLALLKAGVAPRLRAQVVLPWLFGEAFLANSKACEAFLAGSENDPHPPTLEGMERQNAALRAFDSTSWQSKICTPTLVLQGDQDLLCPCSQQLQLARAIPGAQSYCFQGVGHCAQIEQPEQFCKVVYDFLIKK
jgi:pimeloyl-ACP methyl ester carboxylesterase